MLRNWTWRAAGAGVAMALVLSANPTHANGRFPTASQLVVFPHAPQQLVLRPTFGILFSRGAS